MQRKSALDARFDRAAARRGFTLIEVVVVALLIGILATIAIPQYMGTKDKGYVAAMQADLHTAAVYEEQYAAENHGQYFSGVATEDNPVEGFRASKGVTVTLAAVNLMGSHLAEWSATARHVHSSESCESRNGWVVCTTENSLTTGLIAQR